MPNSNAAEFLVALRESQLLPPEALSDLERELADKGDDPRLMAKWLVQRHGLTSYQVNQLNQGRGKELLIGPYRILDRLGEGGMGTVFKARQQTLNRLVALKVLRKDKLASQAAAKRFFREIQTAAQLVHPNIVLSYDAGQVDGAHYFAMEYVEGIDLAKMVKRSGVLPVAQACEYVRQVALGLQYASERGIVHRDVKPANILVPTAAGPPGASQANGKVKILDMGLARLVDADDQTNLTKLGTVLGTPEFLAPEQAVNSHVDTRADVYSLGCTLFFLLAGHPPFKGGTLMEVLLKHRSDEPPAIDRIRPEVPAGLAEVVKRLLAKRPEQRFQKPAEVAAALEPFCPADADGWIAPPQLGNVGTGTGSTPTEKKEPIVAVTSIVASPPPAAKGPAEASPGFNFAAFAAAPPRRRAKSRLPLIAVGLAATVLLAIAAAGIGLTFAFLKYGDRLQPSAGTSSPANADSPGTVTIAVGPATSLTTDPRPRTDPISIPAPTPEPKKTPDTKTDPDKVPEPKKPEPEPKKPEPEPKKPEPEPKKPEPEPKKPEPKKPEPEPKKPEPEPKKPEPELGKTRVPGAAALEQAKKQIREANKNVYAVKRVPEMQALAEKLLHQSGEAKADKARYYTLLREASDLAAGAGDVETSLTAIKRLEHEFAIEDEGDLKADALSTAIKAATKTASLKAILQTARSLSEEASAGDNYPLALRVLALAESAARKLKLTAVIPQIQAHVKETEDLRKEYEPVADAQEKLDKDPDDTAAAAIVGRFLCLFKGDWDGGLPLLVKGGDPRTRDAAEQEKERPTEAAGQKKLGDAWYAVAEKEPNATAKKNLWKRARYWYAKAAPSLESADRASVEDRLKKLDKLLPKDEVATTEKTTGDGDFDKKLKAAQSALRQARYSVAVDVLGGLVGNEPNDTSAELVQKLLNYAQNMLQGFTELNRRQFPKARDAFRAALDVYPNDTSAKYGIMLAMQRGQPGQPSGPPRKKKN